MYSIMSDTESSCSDMYKINNMDELDIAKQKVISNSLCKCCANVFCKECLIPNIKFQMCSKSIPLEIINIVGGFYRCDTCLKMIKVIENENEFRKQNNYYYINANILKVYYYRELNEFPDYNVLLNILSNSAKKLDNRRYNMLIDIWNKMEKMEQLYDIRYSMVEMSEMNGEEDVYKELNYLFVDFMEILSYIDKHEECPMLYGECYGMDIPDNINDIFFGSDSESEYED